MWFVVVSQANFGLSYYPLSYAFQIKDSKHIKLPYLQRYAFTRQNGLYTSGCVSLVLRCYI